MKVLLVEQGGFFERLPGWLDFQSFKIVHLMVNMPFHQIFFSDMFHG